MDPALTMAHAVKQHFLCFFPLPHGHGSVPYKHLTVSAGPYANILFVPAVERGGFEATTYAVVTGHGQIGVHF